MLLLEPTIISLTVFVITFNDAMISDPLHLPDTLYINVNLARELERFLAKFVSLLKDGRNTQQQGALVSRLLRAIKLPLSCSVTILVLLHKLLIVEYKNKSLQPLLSVLSNCKNEYLMMCLLPATS